MNKNIIFMKKSKKGFAVDCEVKRIECLEREFDRKEEVTKLHTLTYELFDKLAEQLPESGRIQLTQFSDAMNRLMCLQATFYYAHGLSDGSALANFISGDKQNVTINITVV
jgi:predicted lipase